MPEITMNLKNTEEGMITLLSSGDILVEGKYYLLKNDVLLNGNSDIRISHNDILRVGSRTISPRKKLIGGVFMFALAGFLKGIQKTVLSHSSTLQSKTDEITGQMDTVGEYADYFSSSDQSYILNGQAIGDAADKIGSASSDISDILGQVGNVINISAIILFVLSIIVLVKYLLEKKKYIEINTEYGSFCILKQGISDSQVDELILHCNSLRAKR